MRHDAILERHRDDTPELVAAALVSAGNGVVRVERGEATIIDQPRMQVAPLAAIEPADEAASCEVDPNSSDPFAPTSFNAEGAGVVMSTQPVFELDGSTFRSNPRLAGDPAQTQQQVDVSERDAVLEALKEKTSPTVTHRSGMTGRTSITFVPGMWLTALMLVGVGFACYLARVLWRPFQRAIRRSLEQAAAMFAITGGAWLVLFVVLPWCVQEVPPFLSELLHISGDKGGSSGDGATGLDAVLATLGLTGLLAGAVRAFSGFAYRHGKAHLGLVTKVAVSILLPLVGVVVFLDLLEFATANGPDGELIGFGIGMGHGTSHWLASDVGRWCLVLLGLLVLATIEAHAWSMFPFYKRRLSEAYAIARTARTRTKSLTRPARC